MTGIAMLELMHKVNVTDIAVHAIDETKESLADSLAVQMSTGIDGEGNRLEDYSPFTVRYKKQFGVGLGAVTDRRTLYMTGEHYRKLYAKLINRKEIEYGSTVSYSGEIQEREGDMIYIPGPDAREEYSPVTLAAFQQEFENITGLKFNK